MYSGRYVIIITLLLLYTASQGDAQYDVSEPLYRITYLTSDDGLSQNTVDCILKDSRGFMWFGTQDGLNRYDGYSFVVYRNDPDDLTSLGGNLVNDHHQRWWL